MKAEIICIGSELLLGDTINTNTAYISKKLSALGIDCYYSTAVGDNKDRIKSLIDIALKRSELIIFTGGLGPTEDDLSVEACAEYFGADLIEDKESRLNLEAYFNKIQRNMPESNLKQVLRPQGAIHIKNPRGTAPGLLWEIKDIHPTKILMFFPGVPTELYGLWESFANDYLKKFATSTIVSEHLKFADIPEATLGEKLSNLLSQENPTVAPLVKDGEATIRISAKAKDKETAKKLIEQTKSEILSLVGEFYYASESESHSESIEEIIGNILTEKKLTLSVAESCTGGLISSRLTDVAGSSNYIKLNLVTYSNQAKSEMLGVNNDTLKQDGAVSEQTALEMAEGIRNLAKTDIGLSITGIAGPGGATPDKPVGLVFVGISNGTISKIFKIMLSQGFVRTDIKYLSSQKTLQILRKFLIETY